MGGLEQQLLGYVIQKERAELEEQREKLLQDVNQNQKNIKAFEAELLLKLTTSDKNLLEDEELIAVLARTKKAAAEVKEKLIVARETEKRINLSREEYRPVAIRGSVLYFLIVETSDINPMYQTSLKQFLSLFDVAIQQAPQSNVSKARIEFIIETLTFHIYKYISRGLFKRHKFLFVLLMACKILLRAGKLQHEAFTALLKGGALLDIKSVRKNQCDWLGDTAWLNIINLSNSLDVFKSLPDLIQRNEKIWNRFYDEEKPEKATIPELHDKLTTFQRLLLVRSLREDRAILASHDFVKETLGEKYIDPIPISLDETWRESANNVPLVCLLSPGSDPTSMIEALAKTHKKDIVSVSMGQGQEKRATELLTTGFSNGTWVLLQNCHLGLKFISTIEDTIRNTEAGAQQSDKAASSGAAEQAQTATGGIHPDFRLWVTSEPNPKFAIGLLQMSIKLTLEGEVGMKAGMKSAFECVSQDMIDASRRPEWRPLLYSTCFLNSIVMERRKFGSLGWNISYEFNYADLKASLAFLQNHFAAIGEPKKGGGGPEISWPTVKYMICEVHYGGKITDDKDRDLFLTYGERWITPEVAKETFQFCEGYGIPQSDDKTQRQKFVEYIEKIPQIDNPEVFGLNGNADITYRTDETMNILSTILDIQPKESAGGSGETREDKVKAMAESLLGKLPEDFNQDVTQKNIARQGGMKSSLNVFLGQEIDRLQRLIGLTRKTLSELILAIDGTIIMSAELQDALNNLYDGRVPTKWVKLSWEATTIGLWFTELLGRREQLHNWLMKERPKSFWLTGFYNPQGFLTAVRQEVTRAHQQQGWALDDVFEKTEVTKYENKDDVGKLDEGVYIHGLYLEGGAWDRKGCRLIESQPKILFVPLPVIHITAVLQQPDNKTKYKCPVYRNKKRNDLTYIFSVDLNCTTATDTKTALEAKAKWKLRGVALLCNYQ
jgi:dynein heavy chain